MLCRVRTQLVTPKMLMPTSKACRIETPMRSRRHVATIGSANHTDLCSESTQSSDSRYLPAVNDVFQVFLAMSFVIHVINRSYRTRRTHGYSRPESRNRDSPDAGPSPDSRCGSVHPDRHAPGPVPEPYCSALAPCGLYRIEGISSPSKLL